MNQWYARCSETDKDVEIGLAWNVTGIDDEAAVFELTSPWSASIPGAEIRHVVLVARTGRVTTAVIFQEPSEEGLHGYPEQHSRVLERAVAKLCAASNGDCVGSPDPDPDQRTAWLAGPGGTPSALVANVPGRSRVETGDGVAWGGIVCLNGELRGVALQAVSQLTGQQGGHGRGRHLMSLPGQRLGQVPGRLGCPLQSHKPHSTNQAPAAARNPAN